MVLITALMAPPPSVGLHLQGEERIIGFSHILIKKGSHLMEGIPDGGI